MAVRLPAWYDDTPSYFGDYSISGLSPIDYHTLHHIPHTLAAQVFMRMALVDLIYREKPDTVDYRVLRTWKAGVRHNPKFNPGTYIAMTLPADLSLPTSTTPLAEQFLALRPGETLTEMIIRTRKEQSVFDYNSAARLRAEIMKALKTVTRPSDFRQIVAALRDIQIIQRISLGLTPDNVGFQLQGHDNDGAQLPMVNVVPFEDIIDVRPVTPVTPVTPGIKSAG